MPWFQYRQNNSGGYYTEPAINVVVEAPNMEFADALAGVAGVDEDAPFCHCCGTRWSLGYAEEHEEKPDLVGVFGDERWAERCLERKEKVPRVLYLHADGTQEVVS